MENCRAGASSADPGNGKRERLPYNVPYQERAATRQLSVIGSNCRAGIPACRTKECRQAGALALQTRLAEPWLQQITDNCGAASTPPAPLPDDGIGGSGSRMAPAVLTSVGAAAGSVAFGRIVVIVAGATTARQPIQDQASGRTPAALISESARVMALRGLFPARTTMQVVWACGIIRRVSLTARIGALSTTTRSNSLTAAADQFLEAIAA